ncbi:putative repeat protein (TIGR01451 family) [Nocardioides cavernae]|uniref:Putative repeat protein (TIGR01451 family) n=1 Tax=Nocardioides cavernae TaxID=1921566 RepID=A0A7Y9H103_9ACTN|nr:DUF11 domain-containing protein [Nocardioides cavernae]NYE35991.1 putative repeat protein (TIGR01451 family) [Nocardioides cavernae]
MTAARSPLQSLVRICSALVLVAVSLALAVVVPAEKADAAVIRPFTTVFSQQTNGSIQITGNTVMTCGATTACQQAQSGATAASNNNFTMTYLDVDADASTTRSSSADLTIPSGGRVLYAGLFWGAARAAGNSGSAATGTAEAIKFRTPGAAGYTTLTADRIDNQTTGNLDYSAYKNVTAQVQAAGAGTYWGADIAAATGVDRYGAWSLVVAVEDPNAPLRDLTVFSGYATVTNNDIIDTSISGFLAPPSGAVGAKFGGVTYEGDNGLTGDYFQVNSTRLADSLSPSANFFTSRVSANGANLTNRNPSAVNNLGVDAKVVDAPGVVPNGATSANLRFATSGDFYYPAALTTQIDLYAPTIQGSKTITNLSGNNPAKVGDVVEYSMTFSNVGDDAATNTVLTDPVPANTTFVPGSIRVTAGANQGTKTDATDADQGEYVAASRTVRVRLGTGASGTAGGTLAPSATTTVAFRATVTPAGAGTTLTNTASLSYRAATIGRDYTYNTAEVATPVSEQADVAITKTASPEPVTAGNQVTYNLAVRNNGPNPASGVQVVDTLPAGVTYVSSNPSSGSCSISGQTLTCGLGTIANAATATVSVVVRVPPGSDATSVTNVARVSTTTSDPDATNNNASATSTIVRQADVALTKAAAPTNPVPGTDVTYTLTATNNGASRAADVTVTDTLPSSLTIGTTSNGCTVTGSQVSCVAGGLDPGQSATFTVVATVPSNAGTAPLTNAARVTSSTPDPTPGNNAATATITPVAPRADLVVTKQAVTSPVVAGRAVQYRVVVANDGPSDAPAVTLSDPLPASLSGVTATSTGGSCDVAAGTVSCAFGTLPSGQSVTVTIDAQLAANATGTLVNSATASTTAIDPAPGNSTGTSSVAITASADLALTKTAGAVVDGGEATYTLVATNNGPSVARSVTVADPVPAPLTFNGFTTSQGTCAYAAGTRTLTCAVGDVPVGSSVTVTVRAQTPGDGSARGVSNTATVSSPTPDPTAANNSATYVLPTTAQADVSLSKSVSPNPVVAGQQVTYTLTARNNGPSQATVVTVTDTVPARVGNVSATASGGAVCAPTSGNTVSCTAGVLASGAAFTVTVTGTVSPGAATGAMANTASVTSATPQDPSPGNNSASASTDVVARADVAVTKTGSGTANAGGEGTWTLRVRNDGPSAATGVVLSDALPAGVTFVSATSTRPGVTCTGEDGLVTCPVGALALDEQVEVTVTGAIAPGLTAGTALTDRAGVSATTPDATPGNNTATHTTTVTELSDVRIAKASEPTTLVPGADSVYVLTATNAGPSDARDVVVTDTLDPDLTIREAVIEGGACTVAGQQVSCTRPVLPSGATAVARIRVLLDADRTSDVVNAAQVTSSTDATPGNNADSITSAVTPSSDVTIVQSASRGQIAAGEGVTYTLTVVNNGPSQASGVTVADTLPAGIVPATATSSAGTCTITGQQVSCALGALEPGTPVTVTIVASTSPGAAAGPRENTATVSSSSPDTDTTNNSSQSTVTIGAEADVQLTKAPSTDTFVPGRQVSWSIVVNNAGPSTARGIVVTDTVPAGVTVTNAFHGTGTPCTVVGREVTCDLGDRVPGQRVVTIVGTLASAYAGETLANTARVTTTSTDPAPGNNTATATAGIVRQTDLEIIKTISDPNPVAGQRITYTLSVYNNGPSDAVNPQLIDQLPSGLTDVVVNRPTLEGVPATAECELRQPVNPGTVDNPTAPTVFCNGPTFRAGLPARVIGSIEATIAPGFTGTLTNTGRVSSDTIDLVAADNESTVTTQVAAGADVSITKSVSPSTPVPGQPVTWSVTVRNDGPSTARNVVVRDDVVDAITGLTASTGSTPNPCTVAAGNDVTCALGDLAPNSSVTITIGGGIPAGFTGSLDNTATVSSPTDTTPGNNSATATSTPTGRADVSITKTVTPATPVPGQPVTWTVVVRNDGPSTARDVVVRDDVADAITGLTASTGATPNPCTVAAGNDVTCAVGAVAPGSAVTVTISGGVPAGFTGGLDNTATVTSPTDTTPQNNTATATSTPVARADVGITMTVNPVRPVPGQPVTYTLVVTNNGPSTARDVTVEDPVPGALTGVRATSGTTPEQCDVTGNLVACGLGDLAPGATVTITVVGDLPPGFTGDLVNTATVASPTDTTPGNNTATVSGSTDPQADVSITKALSPTSPVPGQDVTYTLVVTNNGPSVARAVTLDDDLDDALTGLRVTTTSTLPDACEVVAGNDVECSFGDLAASGPGSSVVVTITGGLPAGFTGDLDNTATVASVTDSTPGNNSATADGTAAPRADVSITNTLSPNPPVPGQPVTYTLVVTNNGPSVARGVTVRDDVDDAVTGLMATGASCTVAAGNDVTCAVGDLAPGASVTITLTGGLPAGFTGPLDNTATVSTTTPDTNPANDSADADAVAEARADVSVSKVLTPSSPVPGRDVSWTLVVSNAGPSVARDVQVADEVDDSITDLEASAPCTVDADNDVSCVLGDLAPGASRTITLTGGLPAGFTGALANTATVTSPTDTTPGNNTSTVSGTAAPNANVGITKTVSPSNPVPGEDVTWTIVVGNTGPSVARDVVVRDDVDDAITGLTATAPCAVAAGNDVTCDLGDLAPGDQVVLTLEGAVPPGYTGELSNTATVSSPTDDTPANNTSTANPTTSPGADLSIVKTASPVRPVPGQDVTWTVTVTNAGPSVARGVVITDDVADALTGVTASAPCQVGTGNAVTCDLGDVGVGGVDATRTVTITGRVPSDFTGDLGNTATVTSPTDTNTGNNTSSTEGTAEPVADLSITKTATPGDPVPGTDTTWTVTVTNAGPSVATDVVVRDDVADALTGVSATSDRTPDTCEVTAGNVVTCPVGTMAVGDTVTVTITGRVPADFTGDLDNTATVSSPDDDATGNNAASTSGTADPQADVSLAKTATPVDPVPGQTATWTLVVGNAGPSVARDVVVTDDLLDQLTGVTATAPCQVGAGNLVTCDLGDLAPGGTRTLTLSGTLPAGYTGAVDNTATVDSPTDTTPGNNEASTDGDADPQADVSITKTATPVDPVPGEDITWTIGVTNAGPSVARDVVVTDDVLDAITGLTATGPCTIAAGNVVTCDLGDVAPGGSRTVTLVGRIPFGYRGPVDNTASVASPTDVTPGNNEASTEGDADAQADVSITKTASPEDPVPGGEAGWTIVVTNAGPSTARDVTMEDDLLDDLTGVTVSTDQPGTPCTVGAGNVVLCILGDLDPGTSATVQVRGTVPPSYTGPVDNTATVDSPTDSTPDNNEATTQGDAQPAADVSVTKTLDPSRPVPGGQVTWLVQVTNAGPSTARDVALTDDVPAAVSGVTVSSNASPEACRANANAVSCDFGDLAPGTTRVVTVRGTLDAGFTGDLANTARVASPTDSTPANNAATATGQAAPRADLSITKTMAPAKPVAGGDVTFTMAVRNAGPSTARQVVVADTLIDPLAGATATVTGGGTCRVEGQQVTCDVAALAAGEGVTVTVRATVDAGYRGEVSNVATVRAATPDPDEANNVARVTESGTGSCVPDGRRGKVVVCPDLDIEKKASTQQAAPGDEVSWTVTVTNAGPSAAQDVEVLDELDRDLRLVSVDVVTGRAEVRTSPRRVIAVFETLRPGAEGVLRIVTRLSDDATGSVPNVAVASTDDPAVGDVEVQDEADVEVLPVDDDGGDPGNTGDPDDDGVLPDTGLPAGVVPLAALSVLLVALGLWMVRRSRVSRR